MTPRVLPETVNLKIYFTKRIKVYGQFKAKILQALLTKTSIYHKGVVSRMLLGLERAARKFFAAVQFFFAKIDDQI